MQTSVTIPIGAGLGLIIGGILLASAVEDAWLWGAGCISLGIAILTSNFFSSLAKLMAIACPFFFLLGLIFQRGWLQ